MSSGNRRGLTAMHDPIGAFHACLALATSLVAALATAFFLIQGPSTVDLNPGVIPVLLFSSVVTVVIAVSGHLDSLRAPRDRAEDGPERDL